MPRRFAIPGFFLLTASLWALPGPDDLGAARRRFEQWRQQPEQLARLRHDWQSYRALPDERREQILQLDHDLYAEKSGEQGRLTAALERYADWLEHLSEVDRRAVAEAPTGPARLAAIRRFREREWMQG